MVFKLIRVDAEKASKIELAVGKHVVGRGKFLEIDDTDKRVSRNHAELEVTEDSVTLKSIHLNPCFYIRRNTTDTEILNQNSSIALSTGDRFGLIPEHFWYELIDVSPGNTDEEPDLVSKDNEVLNGEDTNIVEKSKEKEVENAEDTSVAEKNNDKAIENGDDMSIAEKNNDKAIENGDDMSIAEENNYKELGNAEDTSIAVKNNDKETESGEDKSDKETTEPNNVTTNVQTRNQEDLDRDEVINESPSSPSVLQSMDDQSTQDYDVTDKPSTTSSPSTPSKRSRESDDCSPVAGKKVKTEPDADAEPGTSDDKAGSNSDAEDQKPKVAPPTPPAPPRERCIYGSNCYRRNVEHKAKFSHPRDADWGPGERGVCPYGRACRKADPRHWAHHEHPPGTSPPAPQPRPGQTRKKIQRRRRSESDDCDSEDSTGANLILTGKRTRRPVQRDGWLDTQSDEEEDPYKTDESDEWQPSSDLTNSDFSQKF